MWKIIINEFKYNKIIFISIGIILLINGALYLKVAESVFKKDYDLRNMINVTIIISSMIAFSGWVKRNKEKRTRLFILLPVSLKVNAFAKYFYEYLIFIILQICIFVINFSTVSRNSDITDFMIGQGFGLFLGICLVILFSDLWFVSNKKNKIKLIYLIILEFFIITIIGLIFYAFSRESGCWNYLTENQRSLLSQLADNFILLVISVSTIFTFIKRKSYISL